MTHTSLLYALSGTAQNQDDGKTRYVNVDGRLILDTNEVEARIKLHNSFTVKNLFFSVTLNNIPAASTVVSRINGVNGNLTITVPAGTTGTFEDTVNSDSVVADDYYNLRCVTGAGGIQMQYWKAGVTLDCTTDHINCLSAFSYFLMIQNQTRYGHVSGNFSREKTTEWHVHETVNHDATWDKLVLYVVTNAGNAAATFTNRINSGNGSMSISITALTTGEFTDIVNSDAVTAGNEVNYKCVTGAAGGGNLIIQSATSRLTTSGPYDQILGSFYDYDLNDGVTYYVLVHGQFFYFAAPAEASAQIPIRGLVGTVYERNLFVNIYDNDLNSATTVTTRINAGDAGLTLSIPATTTGLFEDTSVGDTLTNGDDYCVEFVCGGVANTIEVNGVSVTFEEAAAAPAAAPTPFAGGERVRRRVAPIVKRVDPELFRLVAEWLAIKKKRRQLFAS